jgi:peptide/nickel transport system substrate-binding protein
MSKQLSLHLSSSSQLRSLGSAFSFKEKFILYTAIIILLLSLIIWGANVYLSSTHSVPTFGGEYTEGIVGEPLYINPIISQSNEIDAALCQLIFSSLLKYDSEGNLINDLTENYTLSEDGLIYTFKIKPGVKWHDKENLNTNDILFTINLIKDPSYKSSLRGDWQDVQIEAPDENTIVFKLDKPYAPFPNKLTFGILPRHLFQDISADKFLLNEFIRKPIGSGPFVFSDFKKDEHDNIISYQLIANEEYHAGRPFLDKINFNFYPDEEMLIESYNKKEINGFGAASYQKIPSFTTRKDTQIIKMRTPRYFAVFFNELKSKPLANDNVRKALSYATDKKYIINQVFNGYAEPQYSPLLNSFGQFNSSPDIEKYEYNFVKAEEVLDQEGWKKEADGIRKKDGQPLEFTLITTQWPDLVKTAEILKEQWEKLGIKVEISSLPITDIQQNFIKPREYSAILFGQEYFGNDPDPYYFWHSSGKKDPGRNIAVYENSTVDEQLEKARQSGNLDERKQFYFEFEKQVSADAPATFLYSPDYVYLLNKKLLGIETKAVINAPARFSDASHWYIKTKRIKKEAQ